MRLAVRSTLGAYQIQSLLGAGGMGEVYRARDLKLNRDVALKVLPEGADSDVDRLPRFTREAQALAALNHPNIAAIYGFEEGAVNALVLELVEGPTLADRIASGAIPIAEALAVAAQVADALHAAHAQGIVHRDLKPANIKVRSDGRVKVLDFGLARLSGAGGPGSENHSYADTATALERTRPGVILGTAAYMSPEQARGESVDARTDIWAFGCVLFEMLTGRSAFGRHTLVDTLAAILERAPDWSALPSATPPSVRELLRQCMERDRSLRLPDIREVQKALEQARTPAARSARRISSGTAVVGVIGVAAAATLLAWLTWRPRPTPPPPPPTSVVIANLSNGTGDAAFDRTLEPMVRIVLEGAGFITAYDRSQASRALGVRPPENFDESAARELAIGQGLGVVLAGSLAYDGGSYTLSVRATRAITEEVIGAFEGRASDKERVFPELTRLVTEVRHALGDDTSDAARRFAMDALSATSLDVVREYAAAIEALSNARYEDARQRFLKAVQLDPNFGFGYAGVGITSYNLDRQQDAERYVKEAIRHIDSMTERERYRTRGLFYLITNDHQACVKEYAELIERFSGDVAAHNNLALCAEALGDSATAVEEMRRAVEILPKRALYRFNLALYANSAGDFRMGEREGRVAQQLGNAEALMVVAGAQIGQGQLPAARQSYQELEKVDERSTSLATTGLADLASYEGRFDEAVRLLERGVTSDLADKSDDLAATKLIKLAHVHLQQGRPEAVNATADRALALSQTSRIRFACARLLIEAGAVTKAQALADGLRSEPQAESQAFARILDGGLALKRGDVPLAISALSDANSVADLWLGHFDLARAYFEARAFTPANSELERCLRTRGRTLTLFGNEPSYAYVPYVHYYQGRVREELGNAGYLESYRTYLTIRGAAGEDPLLADIRRRAGGLP